MAWAWGYNRDGELGNFGGANRSTPVQVFLPSETTVTATAGGGNHSLALTETGPGGQFSAQRLCRDGDHHQLGVPAPSGSALLNVPVALYNLYSGDASLARYDTGMGIQK